MKRAILIFALMTAMLTAKALRAADNVHFSGALVTEPCTLPVTEIRVDFGTVITKYLYQYQRTKSQPFTIHLKDCDPSVMKTVGVTFEGTLDDELISMLALDSVSSAKGIAIGLELQDGTPLAINKLAPYKQLTKGNNDLTFNAYIQVKPSDLTAKSVKAGEFSATSVFVLSYL